MNHEILRAALEKERRAAEHRLRSTINNAGGFLSEKTGYSSAGYDIKRDRPLHEAAALAIDAIAGAADYLAQVEVQIQALSPRAVTELEVLCAP